MQLEEARSSTEWPFRRSYIGRTETDDGLQQQPLHRLGGIMTTTDYFVDRTTSRNAFVAKEISSGVDSRTSCHLATR
jgi:hypothetical protein